MIGKAGFGHDFQRTDELLHWASRVTAFALDDETSKTLKFDQLPKREMTKDPVVHAFLPEQLAMVPPTVPEVVFGPLYRFFASRYLPNTRSYKRKLMIDNLNAGIDAIVSQYRAACELSNAKIDQSIGPNHNNPTTNNSNNNNNNDKEKDEKEDNDEKSRRARRRAPRSILELLVSDHADFSNEELRDEAKTFVLAGSETTSTAVTSTLYAICTEPNGNDVQDKLYQEIATAWPDDDNTVPLTVDMVNTMTYLDAVFREALRFLPPILMFSRKAETDDVYLDDIKVPKGTRMRIFTFHLQRNVKVWGDRANEFLPERWLLSSSQEEEEEEERGGDDGDKTSQDSMLISSLILF